MYLEGGGGGEETSGEVSAYESGGCNARKNPKRGGSPTLRNIVCLEIDKDDDLNYKGERIQSLERHNGPRCVIFVRPNLLFTQNAPPRVV